MENIGKVLKGLLPYFATPAMLVFLIWTASEWKAKSETVQFDSPSQKQSTVKYVEDAPSPEQMQRKMILDSVNTASAIKSRALRDSITKIKNTRDSLTAVTFYQMKEEIERINIKIKK